MLKKEKNTFNWGLKDFFKLFKIKNENNYLVVLEKNELFDRKNKNVDKTLFKRFGTQFGRRLTLSKSSENFQNIFRLRRNMF